MDFPCSSDSKESAYNVGDTGLIPGSGRYPGKWHVLPTPVENPMDRGACGLQSIGSHRVRHY